VIAEKDDHLGFDTQQPPGTEVLTFSLGTIDP
jgi:hypothetical protein